MMAIGKHLNKVLFNFFPGKQKTISEYKDPIFGFHNSNWYEKC